jgi:hypothetical protein
MCLKPLSQYLSYILAVSFIGGGNRGTWWKPPILPQVTVKLYHMILYLVHLALNGIRTHSFDGDRTTDAQCNIRLVHFSSRSEIRMEKKRDHEVQNSMDCWSKCLRRNLDHVTFSTWFFYSRYARRDMCLKCWATCTYSQYRVRIKWNNCLFWTSWSLFFSMRISDLEEKWTNRILHCASVVVL